jgi:hypothetical protein
MDPARAGSFECCKTIIPNLNIIYFPHQAPQLATRTWRESAQNDRMKETVKLKLGIGSIVEVQSEGEWRQGRVVVLKGEVVRIQFEGGNSHFPRRKSIPHNNSVANRCIIFFNI